MSDFRHYTQWVTVNFVFLYTYSLTKVTNYEIVDNEKLKLEIISSCSCQALLW